MEWVAFSMAGIALALASQVMEQNKKLKKRIKDLEEKCEEMHLNYGVAILY